MVKSLGIFLLLSHAAMAADWRCQSDQAACKSLYVVYDSWHSAIVLEKADLSTHEFPELADFPTARFIEFSWGDRDYFPNPNAGALTAIKAAFGSSGSVLHLVGFSSEVKTFYRQGTTVHLLVSAEAFSRLSQHLSQTFMRDPATQRAPASRGLFAYSRFYPANGQFSLFNTCNRWIAEALAVAGLPISPTTVITSGKLAKQLQTLKENHSDCGRQSEEAKSHCNEIRLR